MTPPSQPFKAAIVGGGPAGLMAAETLGQGGAAVTVYDRMPSVGRKFLMAGRGGLNLTHSEDFDRFLARYGAARPRLDRARGVSAGGAAGLVRGLGQPTFVGSSGRVFPRSFKASPLLRAWLRRLDALGVALALRHRWTAWTRPAASSSPPGRREIAAAPDATVLALGGASWPRLGSDGAWADSWRAGASPLRRSGRPMSGLRRWSAHFRDRFQGEPLKSIAFTFRRPDRARRSHRHRGGARGRRDLCAIRPAPGCLMRDRTADAPPRSPARPVGGDARDASGLAARPSIHLERAAQSRRPVPCRDRVLREGGRTSLPADAGALARLIKACRYAHGECAIERAISTAGGIAFESRRRLMLRAVPGIFAAGEMLDWEAPTGGYLLQAASRPGSRRPGGLSPTATPAPLGLVALTRPPVPPQVLGVIDPRAILH